MVLIGASLFGIFPMVYAIFLPPLYIPVVLLSFGLIFWGVASSAIAPRAYAGCRTGGSPPLSDCRLRAGPAIGTIVQELRVVDGPVRGQLLRLAHAVFGPVRRWPGAGLRPTRGTWLVLKTGGAMQDWAYRLVRWLLAGVLRFLGRGVRVRPRHAPRGH